MRNVLIISYYFPPVNKIAARRYGQMVEFMAENGWVPWVLTKDFSGDLPVLIDEAQIIRVPYESHKIEKESINNKNKINIIKKLIKMSGFQPSTVDSTIEWVRYVKRNADNIIEKLPTIDVVLSTFGPACAFELGLFFKRQFSCPAILDFRDMAAFIEVNKNVFSVFFDRFMEKKYVSDYDRLITVSPTLFDILNTNYKDKKTDVIFNGWTETNEKSVHSLKESRYIYYAGRIYPHRIKGLEYLLCSMKKAEKNIKIKIRSISVKWVEEKFLKTVKDLNMERFVEFLEPCDSETAKIESENAYINLIVEDMSTDNYWSKGNMTGKFMQLLPLDPPLLSIARKDNDMGPILKETGRGKLCSTVDEISDFLNSFEEDQDKYKIDIKKLEKYSKRSQAEKLCGIFNELMDITK